MPIPNVSLDDKSFQEIVNEAIKKIKTYSNVWTDYNISDPGITLIELLAWIAETEIYTLNKITARNYLKFLKLLDICPRTKATLPSTVDFTFDASAIQDVIDLPQGTELKPVDEIRNVIFDTNERILLVPLKIYKIATLSRKGIQDVTNQLKGGSNYFYPFSEDPLSGISAMYIGLDKTTQKNIETISGNRVILSIYMLEEDLPQKGQHGSESPKIITSTHVLWEYLGSTSTAPLRLNWQPLNLAEDTTYSMSATGRIAFDLPFKENDIYKISEIEAGVEGDDIDTEPNKPLFWIRCKLIENHYEITPRVKALLLNTVQATYGFVVNKESHKSYGLPDQVIKLRQSDNNVLFQVNEVQVEGPSGVEIWTPVDDFDASGPGDPHYVCNLSDGTILFGNGIHGKIPLLDSDINISYNFGTPDEMAYLQGGTLSSTVNEPKLNAQNIFPSSTTKIAESIPEAFARARAELRIPFKAVSSEDFEYISINTPGLRVARAKAYASPTEVNAVIVIVVPYSFDIAPVPSKGFLDTVCLHLDKHRLITTQVHVTEPQYVGIIIKATVKMKPDFDPQIVRRSIATALDNFLSPIRRKPEQNAWEFGRPVYRSEVIYVIERVDGVDCVVELSLSGSGNTSNYEEKQGDVLIKNRSLVFLKRYSIEDISLEPICKTEPRN